MERGKDYYDKGEEALREAGRLVREFAEQAVKQTGRPAKESAKHTQDMAHELERSAL